MSDIGIGILTYNALAVTRELLLPVSLAILLLLKLLLLLFLDFVGTSLAVCFSVSPCFSLYSILLWCWCIWDCDGRGCGADVRRADSLPEVRAIDCENAARWVKAKGARRVAKARIADMLISLKGLCGGLVVFAGFRY
jgi:hypothetical protein